MSKTLAQINEDFNTLTNGCPNEVDFVTKNSKLSKPYDVTMHSLD
jgi:hypothetical protein